MRADFVLLCSHNIHNTRNDDSHIYTSYEHMDMIFARLCFYDFHSSILFDFSVYYLSPILGGKHNIIFSFPLRVCYTRYIKFHLDLIPLLVLQRLTNLSYYTKKGYFFLDIDKAFWNHRHCRWFSFYKRKIPQSLAALRDFHGGDCWTRTSDLLRVKQAL